MERDGWPVCPPFITNLLQLIPSPDPSVFYDWDDGRPQTPTLEARSSADGRLLWAIPEVSAPPVVAGLDALYDIPDYGSVTAFSTASLATQTRTPLWQFGDRVRFHAAAVAGDTLYVSGQTYGNPETVYALDAHSGAVRWTFAAQTITGGTEGDLAVGPNAVLLLLGNGAYAMRPADGAALWHESPTDASWAFFPSPTFIGSAVYFTAIQSLPNDSFFSFGSRGQTYIYAVDATSGSLYWSVPAGPVLTSCPRGLT